MAHTDNTSASNHSLMTTDEAASFLRIAASTLCKLRLTGDGPVFMKLGRRVLYAEADLRQWAVDRRRRSTSAF